MAAGMLVEFKKTSDGNLRIELLPEARKEVEEIQADDRYGIDGKFREIIEYQICNSDWEEIQPEEIAALTSSLIFSDECVRGENTNEIVSIGRVYWNPNYAVQDEVQLLLDRGYVEFEGVD